MNDAPITDIRRQILRNIHQGLKPYDGFTGSQAGGALRSVQTWRDWWHYITYDTDRQTLTLTDAGIQAALEYIPPDLGVVGEVTNL